MIYLPVWWQERRGWRWPEKHLKGGSKIALSAPFFSVYIFFSVSCCERFTDLPVCKCQSRIPVNLY